MTESVAFDAFGNRIATDGTFKFQDTRRDNADGTRPSTGLTVRADKGGQRVIIGGDAASRATWQQVESLQAEKFQAAQLRPDGGVAGSVQTAGGRYLAPHEVKADSLVEITLSDGTKTTTTAANAVSLNMLRPARDGRGYENVNPAPAAQAPAAARQPAQETVTPLNDDGSAAVFKLGVSNQLAHRAIEEMVGPEGRMSDDVVREAAKQLDTDPSIVKQTMQKAMAVYSKQYEAHATARGVNGNDLAVWAQVNKPNELKMAATAHFTRQDPRAYDGLIAEFKAWAASRQR
jgi:hypothetical protein